MENFCSQKPPEFSCCFPSKTTPHLCTQCPHPHCWHSAYWALAKRHIIIVLWFLVRWFLVKYQSLSTRVLTSYFGRGRLSCGLSALELVPRQAVHISNIWTQSWNSEMNNCATGQSKCFEKANQHAWESCQASYRSWRRHSIWMRDSIWR